MKVVALDAYTVDFSRLSWERFAHWGEFIKYDRTPQDEVVKRAAGSQAVIASKVELGRLELKALPELRYIGVPATGTNNIDLAAACELGIAVANVPAYSTASVAQMVFAHLLHVFSKVAEYDCHVRQGMWSQSEDFCFISSPIYELAGKTLGLVGFGNIGRQVARIAEAFDMKVLVAAIPGRSYSEPRPSLEEVLRQSDVVSLHCPLTSETKNLIDKHTLSQFKPGAILINTARGAIINEADVAQALADGHLALACLDVLRDEPPPQDNELIASQQTVFTPHIAWATNEAIERLLEETYQNLAAFVRGERRNRVEGG